jgi:hypothetical protein
MTSTIRIAALLLAGALMGQLVTAHAYAPQDASLERIARALERIRERCVR